MRNDESLTIRSEDGQTARVAIGDRVRLRRDLRHGAVKAGAIGQIIQMTVFPWCLGASTITVSFPYRSEYSPTLTAWNACFDWPTDALEAVVKGVTSEG